MFLLFYPNGVISWREFSGIFSDGRIMVATFETGQKSDVILVGDLIMGILIGIWIEAIHVQG